MVMGDVMEEEEEEKGVVKKQGVIFDKSTLLIPVDYSVLGSPLSKAKAAYRTVLPLPTFIIE